MSKNVVACFEKVSYKQFYEQMQKFYETYLPYTNEEDSDFLTDSNLDQHIQNCYQDLQLPSRATYGAAGYDFRAPMSFRIPRYQTILIPTGIRVRIDDGWWLGVLPRSGLGFKYQVALCNTIGVIDSDYYNAKNEGHIMLKLYAHRGNEVKIEKGESFAQGIFLSYGITVNDADDTHEQRIGGFGSTN